MLYICVVRNPNAPKKPNKMWCFICLSYNVLCVFVVVAFYLLCLLRVCFTCFLFILFNDHNKTCQYSELRVTFHFVDYFLDTVCMYMCSFHWNWILFLPLYSLFIKFSTCFWHRSLNMVTALLNFFSRVTQKTALMIYGVFFFFFAFLLLRTWHFKLTNRMCVDSFDLNSSMIHMMFNSIFYCIF